MTKSNKEYDAVVIGAGIGGLTCANLLAKNGLKTLVLEQHSKPGGYVTSYKRHGFTFDVAHVISTAAPHGSVGRILSYLNLDKEIELIELDPWQKLIYPKHTVRVPLDLKEYEKSLVESFPKESTSIPKYLQTLNKIWQEVNRMPMFSSKPRLMTFPIEYPITFKYASKTFKDLLDNHFEDQELKALLSSLYPYLGSPASKLSALYATCCLMSFHSGRAYYPKGGFQKFADIFADGLKRYGGDLTLNSMVTKILLEGGKATGVELENGQRFKARYVISNADSRRTFLKLIGEENLDDKFVKNLKNMELSPSGFVVHLGVDMELEKHDLRYGTIIYSPSYDAGEEAWKAYERNEIPAVDLVPILLSVPSLKDPDLAPRGKHCLDILLFPAPYHYKDNWMTKEGKRGDEYKRLKEELADGLIRAAENVIPDLSKHIVVKEIATPITYERYTLSSEGAWYGMAQIPEQAGMKRLSRKTLIPGLYLTGAGAFPGANIFGAMTSGLLTADEILKGKLTGRRWLLKERK